MATIRDIASLANVSIATVSRVINSNEYVSDDLKKRVQSAMEELNYHPNSIARSLKTDSTMTIGIIILDLSNSSLSGLCHSVCNRLFADNYLPFVCSTDSNPETERKYIDLMLSRKVDGLIINSCCPDSPQITALSQQIPVVSVYRRIESVNYIGDFVDSDGIMGTYSLTKHLLASGHRDIFIINGPLSTSAGAERFQGFCRAMAEVGIKIDKTYPFQCETNYTRNAGIEAMRKISAMEKKPTAILTTNPETQLGVIHYCRENNIRIPEDISLVSYASASNEDLLYIQPTCAVQDPRSIGVRAADLILDRIACPTLPNREIIFPCPIIIGNTVKTLL